MGNRGAFIVLVVSSVLGVGCAVTMTLLALPLQMALLVFGGYVLVIAPLVWSVRTIFRDTRESAHRYGALFESSNDAVVMIEGLTVVDCNAVTEQMFGVKRRDIIGSSTLRFSAERQPEGETSETLARRLGAEVQRGERPVLEWVMQRADGSTFDAEISLSPVAYGGREYAQVVIRDISERKDAQRVQAELEDNLRWAQKMEAVGTLAGGVAHDFNNLMHAVTGYADLLLLDGTNDHIRQELSEIKEAAGRASALTRQLLLFSRRVEADAQRLEVNDHVQQVSKILRRTVPKMVEIDTRLADDLRAVHADSGQLEQVLINLALNAADAMPDGGKLIIETENVTLDEAYVNSRVDLAPGSYVRISVTDDGHGMDAETTQRVFEPFFTTKDPDRGTGLGLAMVYGIVRAHDGQITCYSEPGVGTTFKIYLPAMQVADVVAEQPATERPPPTGTETVLLVDDEPQVREVGEQLLSAYGYTVVQATTGEAALEHVQQHGDDVDVVILDFIMPGMGGRRCLEKLLQLRPNLPVIISSGYSAEATSADLLRQGASAFVSKPYQAKTLLLLVRKVLDRDQTEVRDQQQRVLH